MNTREIIKSVRVYVDNEIIKLDYRTQPRNGKKTERFRHSTGMAVSKSMTKVVEKKKFEYAIEHYYSKLENKEVVLFEDIAELALEEAEAGRRKDDGTKDYQSILAKHVNPHFGKMPLSDIKVKDIKAFMLKMSKLGISQNRYNKYHFVLKRVLDYAHENEYISFNVMTHVKRTSKLFKKSKSQDNAYYTESEVQKILSDTCEGCNELERVRHLFIKTFAHVGLLTGARSGEIMALKFSDINFENRTITIQRSIRRNVISSTKTDEERTIPMVGKLYDALVKWKEYSKSEWVFPNPLTYRPYTYSRTIVDHRFKPMLKRLNIPYRGMYNTRHTFASLSVQKGIPMHIVKECMGHKDIATTQRFYLRFGNLDQSDVRDQLENLIA